MKEVDEEAGAVGDAGDAGDAATVSSAFIRRTADDREQRQYSTKSRFLEPRAQETVEALTEKRTIRHHLHIGAK